MMQTRLQSFLFILFLSTFPVFNAKAEIYSLWFEGVDAFNYSTLKQTIQEQQAALAKAKERPQHIATLVELAATYRSLNDLNTAYNTLQEALSVAEQQGGPLQRATVRQQLGELLILLYRSVDAQRYLREGIDILRNVPDTETSATLWYSLGNALLIDQAYPAALEAYSKASQLTKNVSPLQIQIGMQQARVFFEQNDIQASTRKFQEVLTILMLDTSHQQPPILNQGLYWIQLGELALQLHSNLPKANSLTIPREIFEQALKMGTQQRDKRVITYAKGYLGQINEQLGRYSEALQLTKEAIALAEESSIVVSSTEENSLGDVFSWCKSAKKMLPPAAYYHPLYLLEWQSGRILQHQQKLQDSVTIYQRAIEHLQPFLQGIIFSQRHILGIDDSLKMYHERIYPIYRSLTDVLLQQAVHSSSPQVKEETLYQVWHLSEMLAMLELQVYARDDNSSCQAVENSSQIGGILGEKAVGEKITAQVERVVTKKQMEMVTEEEKKEDDTQEEAIEGNETGMLQPLENIVIPVATGGGSSTPISPTK